MIGFSSGKSNLNKFIAWITLAIFSLQPVGVAAQVAAAPQAPANNRPVVDSAPNGTPVIQITTPSAAGVSRNLYQQFDITSKGLILNNSFKLTTTQLAGYIQGNPNLAGGAARLILNEVTGNHISNLRGYLEVAGQRADVILANRSGIVGNGFGFLNTNRGVLTTGVPVFGGSGSLDAFRVTRGQISVQGTGIDATGADRVDLISRAVNVNAGIWAKELNVVTGSNNVEYNTLKPQTIAGEGDQPQVALDVSALGGMYANKIKLVGTEKGVGVNSQGALAAAGGDLILTNEGKITLSGQTNATGNLTVSTTDKFTNQGTTYAQGNTSVTGSIVTNSGILAAGHNTQVAAQTIKSSGTLAAGLRSDGTVGTSGDLKLAATGTVSATGNNLAGGNLNEIGAAIDHRGATTYAGQAATITATSGDINHNGAALQAGGVLTMSAAGTVKNDKDITGTAGQMTADNIAITASDISNQGSRMIQTGSGMTNLKAANSIDNTGGTIVTNGSSLSIQANTVNNSQGQIQHAGTAALEIKTAGGITNHSGSLASNGQISLEGQTIDNTKGTVSAQNAMNLTTNAVNNEQGTFTSIDKVTLTAAGAVNNRQGVIQAGKGLVLSSRSLNNTGGKVIDLDASRTQIQVHESLQNDSGLLGGNGDVAITGQSLSNQGGRITAQKSLTLTSTQTTDNTGGTIAAGQDITLRQSEANLTNQDGTISAGGILQIQGAVVDNTKGNIAANKDISLTAQSLSGNGQTLAGEDLAITVTGNLMNSDGGQFKANRDLNINAGGAVTNRGSITAVRNAALMGGSITNETDAVLASGNKLNLAATGTIDNSGQLAGHAVSVSALQATNAGTMSADTLKIEANGLTNSGRMNSTTAMNLLVQGDLVNQGVMYAQGNTNITAVQTLTNSGVLAAAHNLTIAANEVASTGSLGAGIASDGSVGDAGDLTVTASGTLSSQGQTLAGGNLTLTGGSLDLSGGKTSAGGLADITATTGDINNTGGSIKVGRTLTVNAGVALKNDAAANGNQGRIVAEKVAVTAKNVNNRGGSIKQLGAAATSLKVTSIDNTGGTLATNGASLTLAVNEIKNNGGQIQHAGTGALVIKTTGGMENKNGLIAGNGSASLEGQSLDNTQGTVIAQKAMKITADAVNNEQGTLTGADQVTLTAAGAVNNRQGVLQAGKGLVVSSRSFDNTGGKVINLDAGHTKITVKESLQNDSGLLGGNGDVDITSQSLSNQGGRITAQNNLTLTSEQYTDNTGGTILSGQDLSLKQAGATLTNTAGTITAGRNLAIQAAAVDNTAGNLAANQDIILTAQSLNGNGQTLAGEDIAITVTGNLTNSAGGQFKANRDLNVTAGSALINQGNMLAVRNAKIIGGFLTNDTNAALATGNTLTLSTTGKVANSGQLAGKEVSVSTLQVTSSGSVNADAVIVETNSLTNSGQLNSTGDINLLVHGDLSNQGTIYAQGNVGIREVQTLTNSGIVAAGRNTTIAANEVASTGALGAGITSNGSVGDAGDLTITAAGAVVSQGQALAGGNLTITAKALALTGSRTYAGGNAGITATTGDINNSGGTIETGSALTMKAAGNVQNVADASGNKGRIVAGTVSITANTINNHGGHIAQTGAGATNLVAAGTIDNTAGTIATNGDAVTLQGSSVMNNSGQLQHAGTGLLTIIAANDLDNRNGTIAGNGRADIKSQGLANTQGSIIAQQHLALQAAAITNTQGFLGGDTVDITSQATLTNNRGLIQATKGLTLTARVLANQNGSILSLDQSGATIGVDQALDNTNGLIGANGDLSLTAASLINQSGQVLAQGTLTVIAAQGIDNTGGKLLAQQDLKLNQSSSALTNTNGTISASGNLTVDAKAIQTANGTLSASKDMNLTTQTLTGANRKLTAGQDVNLTVNSDFTQEADSQLQANRDVHLAVTGTLTNQGTITAVRNASLNAAAVTNNAGATLSAGTKLTVAATGAVNNAGRFDGNAVVVQAQNVNNTGTVTANDLTVQANTINNTGDAAILATTGDMNLNATSSVENKDGANIYSMGNITIAGSARRDSNGQPLDRVNLLLNQSATIEADGDIGIYAKDITNKKRVVEVGQTIVSEETYSGPINRSVYWDRGEGCGGGGRFYTAHGFKTNLLDPSTAVKLSNTRSGLIWLLGTTITETSFIQDTPEGRIAAGGNTLLRADIINNNNSMIIAAHILDSSGVLNNTSQGRVKITTRHLADTSDSAIYYYFDENDTKQGQRKYLYDTLRFHDETTYEQLPGYTSIFGGGQQVIINGPSINNITKNPTNVTGGNFSTLQTTQQSSVSKLQTVLENANLQGGSNLGQGNSTSVQPSNTPVNSQATVGEAGKYGTLAEIQKETGENTGLPGSTALGQSGVSVKPGSTPVNTQATVGEAGHAGTVAEVANQPSMNITLPANGLYTIHSEPGSKYLVETDPRFANYKSFISSDYMLQRLGLDPSKTLKQIGDGFYQQKLIRDQISELTGKQVLNGYSSAQDQYKTLLEGGVTYAQKFNLQVGVALSAEQMAQLTADMVWMVEQEVQGQKVLVPVVYLAPNHTGSLNEKGAIIAGDNVSITADQDIVNQNSTITGGQVNLVAGRDIKNETATYVAKTGENVSAGNDIRTIAGQTATISSLGNVSITAGRDIAVTGAKISAGTDLTLTAGRSLTAGATVTTDTTTAKNYLYDSKTNINSSITASNNVTLTSKQDLNLSGAQIAAGQNLTLQSTAGNINLTAVKDETLEDKKVGSGRNWKRTRTDDETVIGNSLQAGNNITVAAVNPANSSTANPNSGNITIAGSSLTSDTGTVTLVADNNIAVTDVTEKHESLVQSHKKKSGFLSSKTTDKLDYSLTNAVKGSTLSGEAVHIGSGQDLTVKASNVVATNDVNLQADNDVTITSAQETGADEHYKKVKKSGFLSGGGLGFTIGKQSTTTTLNEQVKDEIGSTVGSIAGNVTITAGNNVTSEGTTVVSGEDINITGKNVNIDNTINTYDSQYKYEFKQSGLSVSLGGGVVDTGTDLVGSLNRAGEVQDNRLKALYINKAKDDLKGIGKDFKQDQNGGVSINIGIGSTKITSEQNTHIETVNMSNVTAGGDVTIKATAGDVNFKATNINATNVTVDAQQNINIESAQNKQQTRTNTKSSSSSIGASFGLSGSFGGFTGNIGSNKGKENEDINTHTESVINASGTTTLKSGNDTNIIGSQIKGEKVVADVGGNLNIASKQDTDNYTANSKSSGISFITGDKNGKDGSPGTDKKKLSDNGVIGSNNKAKTNSTYSSVIEQAGIYAGKDGFDIQVGKNTDLKGAVIASDATPDKNKISTDTLTYSDIENKAEYSASSSGVNYNTGKDVAKKDQGLTPNIGTKVSGNTDSTTKSAISPGTIEIRSNQTQDISGLSRDTANTVNALGKIFDKETVQEKQELANLFGQEVFKAIGDLKLKEGSPEKVALDAFAGGLMAKLGGGSFASGAAAAGFNQLLMNELKNIKNTAVMQWASAIVGAAAAKLVGGNAQTGASIAASETKNNYLTHEQYAQYQAQLKELKDKLDNGSITQKDYDVAVKDVNDSWSKIDKEQDKKWWSEHRIVIDGKNTGPITIPTETVGVNMDGTDANLSPEVIVKVSSSDILLKVIQNKLSSGYQSVTQLKDDIITYKEQKDTEYAKKHLAAKGITPDDPNYGSMLFDEYQKAKQQSDAVWGLAIGNGVGDLVSALNALKTFKYVATTVTQSGKTTTAIADEVKVLKENPWTKGPSPRGKVIDDALGNNLGRTFPTVDKLENGVLTSTKSLDVTAKTYQTESGLYNKLKTDIDSLSNFTEGRMNGIEGSINSFV